MRVPQTRGPWVHGLLAVVLLVAAGAAGRAQDAGGPRLRPAWECLPAETSALVRVPAGRAAAVALVERTRLGATLFSPEMVRRRATAWEAILADDPTEGELWRKLQEYGLEADDHRHVGDGDAGFALLSPEREGPLGMGIAWIEPGADVAERMLAALGRSLAEMVEEETAAGNPARRTDVEMAGRPVIWVRLPWRPEREPGAAVDAVAGFTGVYHVLVTRVEGRLVAASALAGHGAMKLNVEVGAAGPRLGVGDQPAPAAADPAETAAALERAAEIVGSVFERFLAAHAAADEPALAALVGTAAGPAGTPLVEAFVRPVGFGAAAGEAPLNKPLAAYGLDTVGPVIWRQALDGTTWRSEITVSLPAPRHGLMRLLDERADPADVPGFVTREPVGFHTVSLDLGRAYGLVREAVLGGDDPPPGSLFAALETQSLAVLGADLPAVLTALGTRHTVVWYPMQVEKAVERLKGLAGRPGDVAPASVDENPMAFVWHLADEAPFRRMMQLAAAGGGEVRDEQGFRIVRLEDVAVALGQKHLVVALGAGVAEKTLAAIRTPPAGDAALAGSPVHRLADTLVPAAPAGLYGVSDHARGGGLIGSLVLITQALGQSPPAAAGDAAKGARLLAALLPTAAEIEGMLGASVMLWRSDDQGIVLTSATELPPP